MEMGSGSEEHMMARQIACVLSICLSVLADPQITRLRARHVRGQTFLMWDEAGLTPDMRVAVFQHSAAITAESLAEAKLLSGDLMPGTSCDFYDLLGQQRPQQPFPAPALPRAVRCEPV